MATKKIKKRSLVETVKRNVKEIIQEAQEKAPDIEKKLEEMRKKLIKDNKLTELGSATQTRAARPECRIPINTVATILDVKVDELLLHFLNGHRISEGQFMTEYRLGEVFFYGRIEGGKIVENKK